MTPRSPEGKEELVTGVKRMRSVTQQVMETLADRVREDPTAVQELNMSEDLKAQLPENRDWLSNIIGMCAHENSRKALADVFKIDTPAPQEDAGGGT